MLQSSACSHQILFTVANAAVVLAPRHFTGVGWQVRTGDVVVNADFSAAQAGEKRLRLTGADLAVRISFAVIDPLRQEARM
jgi:hypothetical protein